ncbi:MAG: hypothetical protein OJJ54_01725 [Pseudonocardia sp.]|nr:hypothetical protein [Pseudonocardia sp.]
MSTRRPRPVLGVVALVAVALAAFAVADPFHLRLAAWYAGVLVAVAAVLVTVWAVLWVRGTVARVAVGAAGLLVVLVWGAFSWLAITITPGEAVVREVAAAPGSRVRLVLVESATFAADPVVYSVRARAGSGPFEQDAPVWVGLSEGAAPTDFRFGVPTGSGAVVEVVAGADCGYRSTVTEVTLTVDRTHRPLRLDGC